MGIDVEDSGNLNPQDEAIRAQKEELIQVFVGMLPSNKPHFLKHSLLDKIEEVVVKLSFERSFISIEYIRYREESLIPTLSNLCRNFLNLLDSVVFPLSISPIISKGVLNVSYIYKKLF